MSVWRQAMTHRVSLRIVIFLTCVGVILACAGAVAFATYQSNSGLILSIARESFERSGIETINNTGYLLTPVSAAIDSLATLFEDDLTSIAKPNLPRLLYGVVDLYPQVYSAYVSSAEDGRFVQVQRIDNGAKTWGPRNSPVDPKSRFVLRTVSGTPPERSDVYRYIAGWGEAVGAETIPDATYDPRYRPFYLAAKDHPGRVLTDIYIFASNGKPGITIAHRLEDRGQFVGVVAADITLDRLSQFLDAQPVGEHGIALILDERGDIIAAPQSRLAKGRLRAKTLAELGEPVVTAAWNLYEHADAKTVTFSNDGRDYLAAFRHFPSDFGKNWVIMEVAPVDDFVGQLKSTFRQITLLSLVIATVAGVLSLIAAGQITKPLDSLTREADRIRALSLDGRIEGQSRIREVQHLIDSMAAMKTALRTLAGEETSSDDISDLLSEADRGSPHAKLFQRVVEKVELRRARETELSLASAIQHSVLPKPEEMTDRPIQISARMRAAREIGGDFYDWTWRDANRLVFVIGDVSGKGIPAALFMASTRTAVRTMIMAGSSMVETIEGTNRLLSENNDRCFFVTLFIGELDLSTGLLTYINAGHEPARIVGADGRITELQPAGPALGVVEDCVFEGETVRLVAGDTVVVLTDGVTDAVSEAGQRFGDERLGRAVAVQGGDGAADVVGRIFDAVDRFAGEELQFDDITCIVLRYRPDPAPALVAA